MQLEWILKRWCWCKVDSSSIPYLGNKVYLNYATDEMFSQLLQYLKIVNL